MQQNNGDYKNVSVNQFFSFMQEKLNQQRIETSKAKEGNQEFISALMPPPPNRNPMMNRNNSGNGNIGFGPMEKSPAELIEMAATQTIQDAASTNGGIEIVKKVNLNFGSLKLNDSKKRVKHSSVGSSLGLD